MTNIYAEHPFGSNLEKFHGKTIEVKDLMGTCYRGKCIAIMKTNLFVILETQSDVIVIKNVEYIKMNIPDINRQQEVKEVVIPVVETVRKSKSRRKKKDENC